MFDFDFGFPQLPPLDLRTATETRTDEDYLLSAFTENTTHPIHKLPNEELLALFNLDSPLQIPNHTSSRLPGINAPHILGLAPSLGTYHTLWRFRYTLEIQLPYSWGKFQTRFNWAGIEEQVIYSASLDAEIKVIRELWCLLRLSRDFLCNVSDGGYVDCVNSWDFIRGEIVELEVDIELHKEELRRCLQRLEKGEYRRIVGLEEWERGVYGGR